MGEIVRAISGTANKANPPNPPLEMPVMITAIMALTQKSGFSIIAPFGR
jgi:hypothetical protein